MSRNYPLQSWSQDGRRAHRIDVRAPAVIREHGASKFEVELLDLSVTGFRFQTIFSLREGTRVWITLPHLSALESIVEWHKDPIYGASFAHALHPAVRDHIVRNYGKRGSSV